MSKIDKKLKFISVNVVVLTVSDTRNLKNDTSGKFLINSIKKLGHKVINREIVKDNLLNIKKFLKLWCKKKDTDIIIITGGTGLTKRDITTEAVTQLSDKVIDGFGELFRQISYDKIGSSAIQSRAIGAVINGKYIFSLPGSTGACKDAWNEILKYQLDSRHRPCNFIEIIPRLS